MSTTVNTDVLIIGAGPAGTVAAASLIKSGLSCCILERQRFPRFVIGESLLPKMMEHLEETDLLEPLVKQQFQLKPGVRLFRNGKLCFFDFSEQYTKGWTWTWQAPRADFDNILAEEVNARGAGLFFETSVDSVSFEEKAQKTTAHNAEGKTMEFRSRFLIDASGYGRVLPRMFGLDEPSGLPPRKSMFVHAVDSNRPAGEEGVRITFMVPQKTLWFWIIPFSNGICSLGFVGDPEHFDAFPGNSDEEKFRNMVESDSYYRNRFRNVRYVTTVETIQNYSASVKKLWGPGFALAGNASEFLDPIFSSGVMFATESGLLAAKLAARQLRGEIVDWDQEYEKHIRFGVDVFRSYVNAWYDGTLQDIFFSDIRSQEHKERICSVLAGYVWDISNPFVRKHKTVLQSLSKLIATGAGKNENEE